MEAQPALREDLKPKLPEYLIQWRTSLWVSIREKESNVWKFITFYASAVALIIGLGEKYTNTFVVAFVIGVLSFWGLGIVIDANSWMARNLKLIGNIEKLFIPKEEYGRLIPGYYSSPHFKYFRPYCFHFTVLILLALVAYLRFVWVLLCDSSGAPWYYLQIMTGVYALGLVQIHKIDEHTRNEYFRFYENACGEKIDVGAEVFPVEWLEFKTSASSVFSQFALSAATLVIAAYCLAEWKAKSSALALHSSIVLVAYCILYCVGVRLLQRFIRSFEKSAGKETHTWDALSEKKIGWGITVARAKQLHRFLRASWTCLLTVVFLLIVALGALARLGS
ncbi:MAG TPA: hypothetical protein VNN62_16720 [Methylomirabilota bacterium]|nr:hypothetical protein [Methylomirabilota bacterium]